MLETVEGKNRGKHGIKVFFFFFDKVELKY